MTVGVLVLLALVFLATVYLGIQVAREQRKPPELRGDWWGDFERQFRAYVRQREIQRRRGEWHHWDQPGGLT